MQWTEMLRRCSPTEDRDAWRQRRKKKNNLMNSNGLANPNYCRCSDKRMRKDSTITANCELHGI